MPQENGQVHDDDDADELPEPEHMLLLHCTFTFRMLDAVSRLASCFRSVTGAT